MSKRVFGKDLRVGDTIHTGGKPESRTITSLEEHPDPNGVFIDGARVAQFAQRKPGMTIESDGQFYLLHRPSA